MKCPICGGKARAYCTTVNDDNTVSRYRTCTENKYHKFSTIEIPFKYFTELRDLEAKQEKKEKNHD